MLYPSRTVSIAIACAWQDAYEFARQPQNLPQWAAGLSSGIECRGGEWIAESPMGTVKVAMTGVNPFGVLDHEVTLPSGEAVHNPMRVMPNGSGCELSFTLFQRDGMDADAFERDAAAVAADLRTLKTLLERTP